MCLPAVSLESCRRCLQLATVLSPRPSAVRASWQTLVSYDPVRLWRTAGFSARSPLLFTAYVSAVGELIESYGVSYHQFADDMQLLVSMDSTNATPAIDRLAHCSAAVRLRFLENGLQLNADKSRVVFLAPLRSSGQLPTSPPSTLLEALWRSHRSSSRLA